MNIPICFYVDCPYCIKGTVFSSKSQAYKCCRCNGRGRLSIKDPTITMLDTNKKTKEENELEYRQLMGTKTVEYTAEDVVLARCPWCTITAPKASCHFCKGEVYANVVKV